MTALAAGKVAAFITSPNTSLKAFLLYGPDAGLVREHAKALSTKLSQSSSEPGEILSIDDLDLAQNPDRLAVELNTVPMFGGQKVVRVRLGQKLNVRVLEPLIHETLQSLLIVEAGELKKGAKIRTVFEKSSFAVALPCYGDDSRGVQQLIQTSFADAGITLSPDVMTYLQARLGADRALSRSEIEKILLYVHGKTSVDIDDIDAVIGDAAELSLEQIVYACGYGDIDHALHHFDRAIAAGHSAQSVLFFLNAHFIKLHTVRSDIDAGGRLDILIRKQRPPIHFKRQDDFKQHCRLWSGAALFKALDLIQQTTARCRGKTASFGAMERVYVERLLLSLSRMVKKSVYSNSQN